MESVRQGDSADCGICVVAETHSRTECGEGQTLLEESDGTNSQETARPSSRRHPPQTLLHPHRPRTFGPQGLS